MLNKAGVLAISILLPLLSFSASASRVGESQATYLGSVISALIITFNAVMFLASVIVLLAGGWFFIRDYVLAKSDHEKKFSIGQLIAAIVVAGILGYPTGAYLLGADLATGDGDASGVIKDEAFKRAE
jgi:uncharacterized membrane protein